MVVSFDRFFKRRIVFVGVVQIGVVDTLGLVERLFRLAASFTTARRQDTVRRSGGRIARLCGRGRHRHRRRRRRRH